MEAFFWYVDDWIGSTHRRQMDHAEQAGYFLLICHAAKTDDGGLPDNDYELAGLSELGPLWNQHPEGSPMTRGQRIRRCFSARDGKIYNVRLLEEFERRRQYKDRRHDSAVKAAEARWSGKRKDAPAMPDGCVTHTGRIADAMHPRAQSIELRETPQRRNAVAEFPATEMPEMVGVRFQNPTEDDNGVRWYTREDATRLFTEGYDLLHWPVPENLADLNLWELGWKLERLNKAIGGFGSSRWSVRAVKDLDDTKRAEDDAERQDFIKRNGPEESNGNLAEAA